MRQPKALRRVGIIFAMVFALVMGTAGVAFASGMFTDIAGNMEMAPGQSFRRNLADTDFEAYTPYTPPAFSQGSVSRSLNSNFVPSSTRNMIVSYSADIACTLSLTGGQSGTVFLEISADGSTNWQEVSRFTNGNSGTLTIGLNITQTNTGAVSGTVPSGWTARLRTANNTGTPTFTYRSGQEATL